jgi:hypothetical protein
MRGGSFTKCNWITLRSEDDISFFRGLYLHKTPIFLIRFFLKRIGIALIISRPAFRGARHLATVGAIVEATGTFFSRNPTLTPTLILTLTPTPTHPSSLFRPFLPALLFA